MVSCQCVFLKHDTSKNAMAFEYLVRKLISMSDKYIKYDPLVTPNGFGISNTGASCWWNALLQVMIGISGLTDIMLSVNAPAEFANNTFALAYIDFIVLSFKGQVTDRDVSKLFTAFKTQLEVKSKISLTYGQQCAHEGFTMFVNMLDNRRVDKLFTISYESTSPCDCGHVRVRPRDVGFYITMQINTQTDLTFRDWIRVHAGATDPSACPKCAKCASGSKLVDNLKQLGEVVCVYFNGRTWDKEAAPVYHFPQTMTFGAKAGGVLKYKLIGTIEHSGVMNLTTYTSSGHYWARTLRDESWLKINDTYVSDSNGLPTNNTLMVFYHMTQ